MEPKAYSYHNKKVLIVDDQRAFQVMLKAMLTNLGCGSVSFADTAEAAVKLCRETSFDLLLVDYNLGSGKNGRQLLEYLRNHNLVSVDAMLFIVTGDNSRSMVLTALELEPDDYLMKPFSGHQLDTRVQRCYRKKSDLVDIYTALREKEYDKTAAYCRRKLKEDTRYKNYCRNLMAEMLIRTERYDSAQVLLEKIVEQREFTWACITLGKVYFLQGKYDKSITTLEKVIKSNALLIDAYEWLGRAYEAKGHPEKALSIVTRAAELAYHSIDRHKLLARLATDAQEFDMAKDSFGAILQLSRNSFYPAVEHLANYVRSILDAAKHTEDPHRRNRILQDVHSALFKGRHEEGRQEDFDFDMYEHICHARVHEAKGEMLKAKRTLLHAIEPILEQHDDASTAILAESMLALAGIGEYEYAEAMADTLATRDVLDDVTSKTLEKVAQGEMKETLAAFKDLNKMGKQAYEHGDFEAARGYFDRALKKAPMNSGAAINKLQASIKLLLADKKQARKFIEECESCISTLEGVPLSGAHRERFLALKADFHQAARMPGKK
ncbi:MULTISPECIES: response regulator [unclassified Motilimonas]|uniref:response regulator n=1 Tax=Motilimonas TaxID=1914248 RepID=UPI001E4E3B16|nr:MULTISPECIES: response regulator [unclassified Motilimonas]MCE0557661.1 response regulator [Motilimonas sp. E26]MDO6527178.1 response regulator [Motilimonas sp. 1_MG-2023]